MYLRSHMHLSALHATRSKPCPYGQNLQSYAEAEGVAPWSAVAHGQEIKFHFRNESSDPDQAIKAVFVGSRILISVVNASTVDA